MTGRETGICPVPVTWREPMKPLGMLGVILIVLGTVVVAMRGLSYVKDRDTAHVGPISVTTEDRGFITPLAGLAAIGIGVVLLTTSKKK